MEDTGASAPVTQVFAGRYLEWRWTHCEHADNVRFLFPQLFGSKVFQKTPNDARMGSFPEVRPKGASALSIGRFRLQPVSGGFQGSAVLRHQRTLVSESGTYLLIVHRWGVHSVHPLVLFLLDYCRPHPIQWIPWPA
jgi:hypothetical protein